jgi:hypothetical protein
LPECWRLEDLQQGLRYVESFAADALPAEGLGGFVCEQPPWSAANRVAAAVRVPMARLGEWLEQASAGSEDPVPKNVRDLVGAGPGLTPSGDDLLGGAMIAAHALRQPDIAERLYAAIRGGDIGRISRAHLDAAREGAGGAPLHALLNDTMCGRVGNLPARFAALGRMGHCSGWDAFAGCVVVLRAFRRSVYSS